MLKMFVNTLKSVYISLRNYLAAQERMYMVTRSKEINIMYCVLHFTLRCCVISFCLLDHALPEDEQRK